MPKTTRNEAVAAAYRVINEADGEAKKQATRLARLHKQTGEDAEHSAAVINEILESGPGAVDRLRATCEAVARLHGIQEED